MKSMPKERRGWPALLVLPLLFVVASGWNSRGVSAFQAPTASCWPGDKQAVWWGVGRRPHGRPCMSLTAVPSQDGRNAKGGSSVPPPSVVQIVHTAPPPPPDYAKPQRVRDQGSWGGLKRAVALFNHMIHLIFSMGDIFGSYSPPPKRVGIDGLGLAGENASDASVAGAPMARYTKAFRRQPTLGPESQTPKKVHFSTRYSCAVNVGNASLLEAYMGLPFEDYSMLDQAFISRVRDNVFRFMVPANELVGLQTVPIVDVSVSVDTAKRLLNITSISSKLVSRSRNGTIVSTFDVGLLQNNSLRFHTHISWEAPPQAQNGPRRNLARLRRTIFRGQGATAGQQGSSEGEGAQARAGRRGEGEGRVRRLRCSASVDVAVVVPPPLSLIPRVVLRQGASVILSTIVTTLVNRFLDLLMQDYQKWALADGSRANGSLLGYQPDIYEDRSIETGDTEKDDEEVPEIEYMI